MPALLIFRVIKFWILDKLLITLNLSWSYEKLDYIHLKKIGC